MPFNIIKKNPTAGEVTSSLTNASDAAGLHFDGVASNIDVATWPDLGSKWSAELILQADEWGSDDYHILDWYSGERIIIAGKAGTDSGKLAFYRGGWVSFGVEVLEDLKVHHIVIVVDESANTAILYDNGNQVASITPTGSYNVDDCGKLRIGSVDAGSDHGFDGTMYRVRLWNKTLTSAEVTATYENATVPFADQYGSQTDLAVDGTFSDTANWTEETGWAVTGGKAVATSAANAKQCYQAFTYTVGKKYRVQIEVSGYLDNGGGVYIDNLAGNTSPVYRSNGTHSFEFTALSAANYINLRTDNPTGTSTLDVEYVSLVEIGCVSDYDLAFANPTQSDQVQDRAGAADGTSSATGVKQVTPIEAVNTNKLNVGGTTPLVGIGLAAGATPTEKLQVDGAALITGTRAAGVSSGLYLSYGESAGRADFVSSGVDATTRGGFKFTVREQDAGNAIDALTIDSAGNVGVGAPPTNPDAYSNALSVKGGGSGNGAIIYVGNTVNENSMSLSSWAGAGSVGTRGAFNVTLRTNNTTRVTLDGTSGLATFSNGIASSSLLNAVDTSLTILSGGSATNNGANLTMYGGSASSGAGSFRFRNGTGITAEISSAGLASFSNGIAVNDTSGNYGGKIVSSSDADGTATLSAVNKDTSGTRRLIDFFAGTSTSRIGSIETDGSATAFNTSSDYRLKENVTPLTGALDRLDSIPVYNFNFKADPTKTVDGFLAHEVAEFVPEAISGEKDEMETVVVTKAIEAVEAVAATLYVEGDELPEGKSVGDEKTPAVEAVEAVAEVTGEQPKYQGIDQSKLVPLMLAAIKELKAKVETLENA